MSDEVFESEKEKESRWKAFFGVGIYTLLMMVLGGTLIYKGDYGRFDGIRGAVWDVVMILVSVPTLFYVQNEIVYMVVRALKGNGDFWEQIYLQSLVEIAAGILIIAAIMARGVLPSGWRYVEPTVIVGLVMYVIVQRIHIVKVVHRVTMVRSLVAVLAPFIVVSPCLCAALTDLILSNLLGAIV